MEIVYSIMCKFNNDLLCAHARLCADVLKHSSAFTFILHGNTILYELGLLQVVDQYTWTSHMWILFHLCELLFDVEKS